jgi:ATP-binding cassette subfamily B protein
VREADHARPLPERVRGHVELTGVSYTHPTGKRPALRDVSLVLEPGQTVALLGSSGAGKSTLARLLVRFADPQTGAILVDGHDVRDLELVSLRRHVGLLLQDTHLPDVTAFEAIAQGRSDATDEEVFSVARAAGIHDVLAALPDGYATAHRAGRLSPLRRTAPAPRDRARVRPRHRGDDPRRADDRVG